MVRVAGEGLRSVGEDFLSSSKSVCSILPLVRRVSGRGILRGVPALRFAASPRPDPLSPLPASPAVLAHNTRRYAHPLAGAPGLFGPGQCSLSGRRGLPLYGVLRSSC